MIYGRGNLQNWSEFEEFEPVSKSRTFYNEAIATFENGPTAKLVPHLQDSRRQKKLTPEEAKDSPYYRDGIDVSSGITLNELIRKSQAYDDKELSERELARLPNNFMTNFEKLGVSFASQFSDPLEDAALFAAPELIGVKASAFVNGIANPIVKRLAYGGIGAAEGAVISAPQIGANYIDHDDMSMAQIMSTVALNSGFQAGIRFAFGVKHTVSDTASKMMNQTAVNQGFSGKLPKIDAILQQGYFAARKADSGETRIDFSGDNIKENLKVFNLSKSELSNLKFYDLPELKVKNTEQLLKNNGYTKKQIAKQLSDIFDKNNTISNNSIAEDTAIDMLNAVDKKALDNQMNLKEKLVSSGLTDEDLNANYLPKILNEYFEDFQNVDSGTISETSKKITDGTYPLYVQSLAVDLAKGKKTDNLFKSERELIAEAKSVVWGKQNNPLFESQLKALNKREKELNALDEKYGKMSGQIQAYQSYQSRRNLFKKAIKDNEAAKLLEVGSGEPINNNDLQLMQKYLDDVDNNFTGAPNLISRFDNETEALDADEGDESIIDEMENNLDLDNLSEEEKRVYENIKNISKEYKIAESALNEYTQCMLSGGE